MKLKKINKLELFWESVKLRKAVRLTKFVNEIAN